ncbi:hypothetical protein L2E82_06784 [Cichorium intybus]|uniref:Uncharacterized protein n=1 Tax=Cichorium intybus TaxID=13427 RepID=A0ACB9HAI5_CICIN|nr:hypothetical protein L2E82_06784 [Cichorium intybus]
MEKQHQTRIISHVLVITTIISLAVASFALCIICEFKKSKKEELRLDGKLCHLPQSRAFGYGIAALMCSLIAQVIGTGFFVFCRRSCDFISSSKTSFASILLCFSWTSFFIAAILMGTATSMSRKQTYGEGWVDGKCYLVKNGVFVGSGMLALIAMISTLLSCYLVLNMSRAVHAQGK